jgi:hypothetical protein
VNVGEVDSEGEEAVQRSCRGAPTSTTPPPHPSLEGGL